MQHIEVAKKLFEWNIKNLVHDAHLKKSEISNYFADFFLVKANGKTHHANYDNYFEFLNVFRSTIRAITYEFDEFIIDQLNVVIPMKARIIRLNSSIENFEAILILKFNENKKIVLWHELYMKI